MVVLSVIAIVIGIALFLIGVIQDIDELGCGGMCMVIATVLCWILHFIPADVVKWGAGILLWIGLALTGFAFSQTWIFSLAFIALVGLGQATRMTLSHTLLQYYVDPEYRGRVMSIYSTHFGLNSIGAFAAGIVASSIGVQWSIGGFAIAVVVISITALLLLPQLRRLD